MSSAARRTRRVLACCAAAVLLCSLAAEVEARGRGGGGFRGGGRGGISRGGPARGGSIRHERAGGDYRSYDRGGSRSWDRSGTFERDGSFENRRGETIDYSGSVTRTEDGLRREGSWESSSGASGGGVSDIGVQGGEVQSRERTGHVEGPGGETMDREVRSERHDDHVHREAETRTSTGVDAESKGTIKKTDDGFVARGGVVGKDGAAGGTIVRKDDQTRIRGGATDGKHATWGRVHCSGSRCYGGRVTVNVKDYYRYPYYYYPYYYGWYSCAYGSVRTWYGRYGTPVYGCSNVVVIHTTISLGATETHTTNSLASTSRTAPRSAPREADVSSAPVLMYEISPEVVAYATSYKPVGVLSERRGENYYWLPGPAEASPESAQSIETASAMAEPTANATVITYEVDGRIVYLTNERPVPGFYAETWDHLFVWIPGVREPTDGERELMRTVISAQQSGGKHALDREVRRLEAGREPPPDAEAEVSG